MIPEVIEVLLVDDDQLMRAGLRLIVQQAPGLTVVGEAADGREAWPPPGRPPTWCSWTSACR